MMRLRIYISHFVHVKRIYRIYFYIPASSIVTSCWLSDLQWICLETEYELRAMIISDCIWVHSSSMTITKDL
ncbi:hypothetical protein BDV37DRAFT_248081 [Aspergillus pseudonomiae]|uniref:Uncharacterized protein n=1 Tax=Aspergillus pseudonomiae TaxID=1506151 RepID=A0A5N7DCD7_9EURO|nr:uncharacterized protein BDV37DRAFT_248081 [Aspergillus pseudonomiae]KAE8404051.1 hypothetical protein BDV37DRAFT_248081 [Aspergillus pseudonomiae]